MLFLYLIINLKQEWLTVEERDIRTRTNTLLSD